MRLVPSVQNDPTILATTRVNHAILSPLCRFYNFFQVYRKLREEGNCERQEIPKEPQRLWPIPYFCPATKGPGLSNLCVSVFHLLTDALRLTSSQPRRASLGFISATARPPFPRSPWNAILTLGSCLSPVKSLPGSPPPHDRDPAAQAGRAGGTAPRTPTPTDGTGPAPRLRTLVPTLPIAPALGSETQPSAPLRPAPRSLGCGSPKGPSGEATVFRRRSGTNLGRTHLRRVRLRHRRHRAGDLQGDQGGAGIRPPEPRPAPGSVRRRHRGARGRSVREDTLPLRSSFPVTTGLTFCS